MSWLLFVGAQLLQLPLPRLTQPAQASHTWSQQLHLLGFRSAVLRKRSLHGSHSAKVSCPPPFNISRPGAQGPAQARRTQAPYAMDGSPQRNIQQRVALQPARDQPSSPLPAPRQPVSQQPDNLQPQTYEDAWSSIVASGGLDFRNYRAQGDRDGAASNTLRWKSAGKGDGAGGGSGCGCGRTSSATLLQFQPHVLQPLAPPSPCGVPSADATWRPCSVSGQDSDSEASSGNESASEGASEGTGSSDPDGSTLGRCQPDSRGRSSRCPASSTTAAYIAASCTRSRRPPLWQCYGRLTAS